MTKKKITIIGNCIGAGIVIIVAIIILLPASIKGEWKLYATSYDNDSPKSVNGRVITFKFEDEICYWDDDTLYYRIDGDTLYLARKKENLSSTSKSEQYTITKLTGSELVITSNNVYYNGQIISGDLHNSINYYFKKS